MTNTKLKLRKRGKVAQVSTVYIQYTYNEVPYYFSTDIKVETELWKASAERVIGKSQEVEDMNLELRAKLNDFNKLITDARRQGIEPTPEYLRECLSKAPVAVAKQEAKAEALKSDLLALFQEYTDRAGSTKTHGTVKHYKSSLNHLLAFAKAKRVARFPLDSVDLGFYHDFIKFLLNEQEIVNGTVNNQIKRLKVVMKYAYENGYTTNRAYERFKKLTEYQNEVVFLTLDELDTLVAADLSDDPKLARVRDMLVFACATGLRHSDFSRIKAENIHGDELRVQTQKTRDRLVIPLNRYSRPIAERYPNGFPKLSQQKFNDYVKKLGQRCGIDSRVAVVEHRGGKQTPSWKPKYELLSSHTGRRTFISQGLERGMPTPVMMTFTGHKDHRTLSRYIKVEDKLKREQMEKAWG